MTSVSKTNSTNVRPKTELQLQLTRGVLRALSVIAPEATASWAERKFLTPRRHPRPERESEWQASAERGEVRYRKTLLPTYSWGAGPRVLLVHGWEGRATQLGAFVAPLVAAGYRAVAVDMPGHGAARPALSSVADFALALTTILERLGPFHGVIGHSMGGAAAAVSYALRPAVERLVTIGAPRGPQRFLESYMRHLGLNAAQSARVARRIERRYGMPLARLDVADFGARVVLPTLVIHDRGDKEVLFDHALAISESLPSAALHATEGLGHRRILRDAAVIEQAVRFVTAPAATRSVSPAA